VYSRRFSAAFEDGGFFKPIVGMFFAADTCLSVALRTLAALLSLLSSEICRPFSITVHQGLPARERFYIAQGGFFGRSLNVTPFHQQGPIYSSRFARPLFPSGLFPDLCFSHTRCRLQTLCPAGMNSFTRSHPREFPVTPSSSTVPLPAPQAIGASWSLQFSAIQKSEKDG